MRTMVCTSWLLFAMICLPLYSTAQSQPSDYAVSVRELRIPPKALHEFDQGMERLAKKDAAGSLPHFQHAILEYAGYYEAYDKVGVADLQLWHISDAEQAFRKAIEVSGGRFAHPLFALGAILDGQEKFVEAESAIRKGLGMAPESWKGHFYLALALFGLNRVEEAEISAREALHWKPEFPEAQLLLADIHAREEDYRSLMSDLDDYLRLCPEGPSSDRVKALREFTQGKMSGLPRNTALAQTQP